MRWDEGGYAVNLFLHPTVKYLNGGLSKPRDGGRRRNRKRSNSFIGNNLSKMISSGPLLPVITSMLPAFRMVRSTLRSSTGVDAANCKPPLVLKKRIMIPAHKIRGGINDGLSTAQSDIHATFDFSLAQRPVVIELNQNVGGVEAVPGMMAKLTSTNRF